MENNMKMIVNHVSYQYNKDIEGSPKALDDVNIVLRDKEFVCLIGHTGSGKSTLVQQLNGLIQPDEGEIYFHGEDIWDKDYDRRMLRSKVGLVFQYPEHQLFEETVFKDVCFGPKNCGLSRRETELRAYEALKMVGIEDDCFYVSPFDLSGGQRRKVAIAGIIAMKPEILVLDEPTAGLDPKGRRELLDLIASLKNERNVTIVLVSHSMEDVANYADRIIVMNEGKVIYNDEPKKVFSHIEELEEIGLRAPEIAYIVKELNEAGVELDSSIITIDEACEEIVKKYYLLMKSRRV